MQLVRFLALGLCIGLCFSACKKDEEAEDLPDVDCSDGTAVPTFAEVNAFKTCTICHKSTLTGAQRMDADDDVNYDTYAAAMKSGDEGASEVNKGDMPPPEAHLTISDADKKAFYRWALCGAPQ